MSNQETSLGQAILVENQVSYLTVHFLWGGKFNFTLEKLNTVGIWNPDQSGFQMIKNGCKWSGSEVRNPNQLKSGQMAAILSKPFEIPKKSRFWMVQFLNVWDWSISQRWSPIIWKLDHLKSDPQKVWISNGRISDPQCAGIILHINKRITSMQAKHSVPNAFK